MVMDDVIVVAMVMDDVRGPSQAPEEPMVRSLAQKFTCTLFLEIKCVRKYIILNEILSPNPISNALPLSTLQRKVD